MKYPALVFSLFALLLSFAAWGEEETLSAEDQAYLEWAHAIWSSIERKKGEVNLADGIATLNVPDEFYYLSPKDAATVLTEVWGNPPEVSEDTLGMLFPDGTTPFDGDSWAVTIEYEEDGYVSDKDAEDIDYSSLLATMQEDTEAANQWRIEQGYKRIELVGWAAAPYYDKSTHKLHWAKELKFGDDPNHTLNYNIRVLGRKGVLVLNFIAGMDQKALIDQELDTVLAMAEFDDGNRYADFNPDIDKVAAYGIGGLVAGKVLAKTGLFAIALVFLKKFGVFILVGVGVVFKKLLSGSSKKQ